VSRRIIVCGACGETRAHRAHGWCEACHRRWRYHGRPADGPPQVRALRHEDVVGTARGWDWHKRNRTTACQSCRDAHNADVRLSYQVTVMRRRARQHYFTAEQGAGRNV
jgi:hypothetical protein